MIFSSMIDAHGAYFHFPQYWYIIFGMSDRRTTYIEFTYDRYCFQWPVINSYERWYVCETRCVCERTLLDFDMNTIIFSSIYVLWIYICLVQCWVFVFIIGIIESERNLCFRCEWCMWKCGKLHFYVCTCTFTCTPLLAVAIRAKRSLSRSTCLRIR